jgi:hypothetical protein
VGVSVFTQFTKLVTARDLQTPLGPKLASDFTVEEGMQHIESIRQAMYWPEICLVTRDEKPVGWVTWWLLAEQCDDDEDGSVGQSRSAVDAMRPIDPGSLVSADTSALAVARLVAAQGEFLFVVDGNDITGTLAYENLFKPPFRVCLFSLMIQLEEEARKLISLDALCNWQALSASRQQKAIDVFNRKNAEEPSRGFFGPSKPVTVADVTNDYRARSVLKETTFIDKGTIIQKQGLVSAMTKSEMKQLFARAERVRNACVHAGTFHSRVMVREEFWRFVNDIHRILRFIDENTPEEIVWRVSAKDGW